MIPTDLLLPEQRHPSKAFIWRGRENIYKTQCELLDAYGNSYFEEG